MSTCSSDHMPTCLYAPMLIRLDALMIICSHACMLSFTCSVAHMSICFDDRVCSHVDMLGYLQLIAEMLGCSLV